MRYLAIAILLLLCSCSQAAHSPDFGKLYNRAAQHEDLERNPVIVIPGVLGSVLVDEMTRQVAWGSFSGTYAQPKTTNGAQLISVPMRKGAALSELDDSIVADGVLGRLRVALLLGLPVELNAYYHILGALGAGGYRDEELAESGAIDYGTEHYTCFQFPYDWRRDLSQTAKALHEFILEKRKFVQEQLTKKFGVKEYDVKFDIVAHSMGGLLTRYYLRYGPNALPDDGSIPPITWEGAKYIEQVVMVGTPNAGSLDVLPDLAFGKQFAPIFPTYDASILGTMPALYQLMPRPRHKLVRLEGNEASGIDLYDPQVWIDNDWGLASPREDSALQRLLPDVETEEERREIALDHLQKVLARAKQFAAAVDAPAKVPDGLRLNLIAGDAEPTQAGFSVDANNGKFRLVDTAAGDGTVLRSSALMDERIGTEWSRLLVSPIDWDQVTFLFTDHIGLTKDPTFTDNILFLLLEKPR